MRCLRIGVPAICKPRGVTNAKCHAHRNKTWRVPHLLPISASSVACLTPNAMTVPAFVYIVPARFEDILKIGFSREPGYRIRSFHTRYFEYFDLDLGFVITANDEKDARRIERLFASRFADHRTHAPLVIEQAPGGFTEWYRCD